MYVDDIFSNEQEIDEAFTSDETDNAVLKKYFKYLLNSERKIRSTEGEWIGFFYDGENSHLVGPQTEEYVRGRLAAANSTAIIYKLGCAEEFFDVDL